MQTPVDIAFRHCEQSWLRESEQSVEWIFCLTGARVLVANQEQRWRSEPVGITPPAGRGGWSVRRGQGRDEGGADRRLEGASRQDRRADPGERFFRRGAHQGGIAERKAMIDREHDLPISRQAEALGVSRGAVYYKPRPTSAEDLRIMRRLDELHLDYPFAGSRMLRDFLNREGVSIGRRHVASLMKRIGIAANYRRPNTSKPAPGHKIHPYLLRGVKIERANQVWARDITYIPMARGFVYLAAVVDWFTRRVLSHRVSITMEAGFCVEALEEAIGKHAKPEIFNSDQGSQFTSEAFTGALLDHKIAISMDGKGSWRDNVFVERLWKSVKYEEVKLKAYDTVAEARASLSRYLDFFNRQRPHSSLDRKTPDEAYFTPRPFAAAA